MTTIVRIVRLKVARTIAASPSRVWSVIEPVEDHVDWMVDAERIVFTTARTRGVGTVFECVTRVGPFRMTDVMRINEWEPGRCLAIEHVGVVSGTGRFTLRRTRAGHTRFVWKERLRFPWWLAGPAGAFVARPVLRRIWRANLRRLAAICEG